MLFGIDFAVVFKIVVLDIMLGGDNAIVIALACAALPIAMRKQAILMGTGGAVAARAFLLAIAAYVLKVPFMYLIAGAALLYIGYGLIAGNDEDEGEIAQHDKMMKAVWTIIVADVMMSVDNVVAIIGAASSTGDQAIWYAVGGIALSIPIIVFGSTLISKLMDRFPIVIWFGGGLLGWIGAEMMIKEDLVADARKVADFFEVIHTHLGDYTDLTAKICGFVAVLFAVAAVKHFKGRDEAVTAEVAETAEAKA